jgi:hypothetical protein
MKPRGKFIDIFLAELVADLRIESSIGGINPLPPRSIRSDIGIRHEMHKIELQGSNVDIRFPPVR